MLHIHTLSEIRENRNTGVEYEIAMFYQLLNNDNERQLVEKAINQRHDADKIREIASRTNITAILNSLKERDLTLLDVSFETQEDRVGPSDVVMHLADGSGYKQMIGLSIKYANSCSMNITGRNFITDDQIAVLRSMLPQYTQKFLTDMSERFGRIENWLHSRKKSPVTDEYIDLIRDAVIENWSNVEDKAKLLSLMFHKDSPIEFWVATYRKRGYKLQTEPPTVDKSRADEVYLRKHEGSFIDFYLCEKLIGRMQVKFNNGFVEKCNKKIADLVWEGKEIAFGHPFSSWNFSTKKR